MIVIMNIATQVRNVALGIVSRRIEWQQLTVMETVEGKIQLLFAMVETRD